MLNKSCIVVLMIMSLITGSAYGQTAPHWFQISGQSAINARQNPYRAQADGVTDDTAALQAAIDAAWLSTTHKTVDLYPGVYRVTGKLHVWSGVSISGRDATILRDFSITGNSGDRDGTFIVMRTDTKISGITIDDNRRNATTPITPTMSTYHGTITASAPENICEGPTGVYAFVGNYSVGVTVENCFIRDSRGTALRAISSANVTFQNNIIDDYADHGVYITGFDASPSTGRNLVLNNTIYRDTPDLGNYAIKFSRVCTGHNVIRGNIIQETGVYAKGIHIDRGGEVGVADGASALSIDILNNTINAKYGLLLVGEWGPLSARISGNHFICEYPLNIGNFLADAYQAYGSVSVSANTFSNYATAPLSIITISTGNGVAQGLACYIHSNIFQGPHSVQISDGINPLVITDNTAYLNDSVFVTKSAALRQDKGAGDLLIAGNTIYRPSSVLTDIATGTLGSIFDSYAPKLLNNTILGPTPDTYIMFTSNGINTELNVSTHTAILSGNYMEKPMASSTHNISIATRAIVLVADRLPITGFNDLDTATTSLASATQYINVLKNALRYMRIYGN